MQHHFDEEAFQDNETPRPEILPAIRTVLNSIGEDPHREGLQDTPLRVSRAMDFLSSGYRIDPGAILKKALFEESCDEMVLVRDIEVYSLCEHHMLPFFGQAHVAYLPDKKIVGLSKIPRIVDVFARRLQVQERLTTQIAECIQEHLQPRGVAVVIEAVHFCMMMRGVQKQNSKTITSSMLGAFRKGSTRNEFLGLIRL
jgi:GTP cyclohydrolase I